MSNQICTNCLHTPHCTQKTSVDEIQWCEHHEVITSSPFVDIEATHPLPFFSKTEEHLCFSCSQLNDCSLSSLKKSIQYCEEYN